jgi:hypothetical protein
MAITKQLRHLISKFQNPQRSAKVHGGSYARELIGGSIVEAQMHEDIEKSFAELGEGYSKIIADFSKSAKVAVDIGAGTGWLSTYLGKFFETVISVEPTIEGITLGKKLLLKSSPYSKISYFQQKAEGFLATAYFVSPVLVFFQTVLSHLPDKQVQEILSRFDQALPIGSKVIFSEVFGQPHSELMWFVRDSSWWEINLPNWEFDFFGKKLDTRDEFKGFVATRVK